MKFWIMIVALIAAVWLMVLNLKEPTTHADGAVACLALIALLRGGK